MKKKFAFMLMDPGLGLARHAASLETDDCVYYICTVGNADEAKSEARDLMREGIGVIELCGAFGPALAREISEATERKTAVGYVIHDPDQDALFKNFFGR